MTLRKASSLIGRRQFLQGTTGAAAAAPTVNGSLGLRQAIAQAANDALPPCDGAMFKWTSEQQLFGYRNMEKIYRTRVIHRGAHVHVLPTAVHQISPQWIWKDQAMDISRYVDAMRASGVIVLKDGQIVLERYGLGREEKDRWTSFSVTKSVTSILIGAAIKDSYIKSLDAPVTDYIQELKGSAYEGVTVRHLLTMTSGVKWNEDYTDPQSDVVLKGSWVPEPGVNRVVSYMRRLPRANPPGEKFVYKSGETDLAGILLSKAVGKSMSAYASEKLWQPYGMEEDAVWVLGADDHEPGGGLISMTLRDYARVGQFMLDGGKANGVQVLPLGWVQDATSAHVSFPARSGSIGYGYFWWIYPDGYAASGIFGQSVFVYPKDNVVIAINSAWPKASDPEYSQARSAFVQGLREAANAER